MLILNIRLIVSYSFVQINGQVCNVSHSKFWGISKLMYFGNVIDWESEK